MAKLLVQMDGMESRSLVLRMGSNRVGRSPECDFQIEHSTISSVHCELILSGTGLILRDCNSTNGTFVEGKPIYKETPLQPGQVVHLGDVPLFVESAEVTIAIPQFQQPSAIPVGVGSPPVLPPGTHGCEQHASQVASYQCTTCKKYHCAKCVRSIKRQGGQAFYFCPTCNGKCQRVNFTAPKKKTFLDTLRKTVKLPFEALAGRAKR